VHQLLEGGGRRFPGVTFVGMGGGRGRLQRKFSSELWRREGTGELLGRSHDRGLFLLHKDEQPLGEQVSEGPIKGRMVEGRREIPLRRSGAATNLLGRVESQESGEEKEDPIRSGVLHWQKGRNNHRSRFTTQPKAQHPARVRLKVCSGQKEFIGKKYAMNRRSTTTLFTPP